MLSVHLPQPGRGIDWHMAGVGHWMLLLLLSVTACILPVSARSQLHLGKAQTVTLLVFLWVDLWVRPMVERTRGEDLRC